METLKWYDYKGRLSEYSLTCGYIELKEKNNIGITLWKEGVYHVKKYNYDIGKRIFWESFETRIEAYNYFNKHNKELI